MEIIRVVPANHLAGKPFGDTQNAERRIKANIGTAREIAGPKGGPADQWLEFEWNGLQLEAIHGYQGTDEKRKSRPYVEVGQWAS